MTRTRSRIFPVETYRGVYSDPWSPPSEVKHSHTGSQVTEDFVHNWPQGRGTGDVGGPFKTSRSTISHSRLSVDARSSIFGYGSWEYHGTMAASDSGPMVVHVMDGHLSDSQIIGMGSTAIARSVPTAPAADVSVMLGELFREGVPRAVGAAALKNRFSDYRDIGGEYLNLQFGWLPIVRDIKSVAKAVSDSEKTLKQLERDSGRNVRRKFKFPPYYATSQTGPETAGATYAAPAWLPNQIAMAATAVTDYRNVARETWFSGCFTFHFQLSDKQRGGLADQAAKARVLLGLDLTPEVLWNLSPWSWMADWVSNAGDVMSNVSRFARDDLAMRYGYIMNKEESIRTLTLKVPTRDMNGNLKAPATCSTTWNLSSKSRMPATPYGFGLNFGDFSPRQMAILGALGISRGPHV